MKQRNTVRWRGTLLAAGCIIAGGVIFYGFGTEGSPIAKALLYLSAVGAFGGGVLSGFDSLKKNTNRES
jgi:hypothetical protein